ncbi:hypothetical protein DEO72_LG10g2402 [Vigna unguiculata]|uniref:Uncharacterized protein n=1 Tax=Vigna unguiculata TaxID=3917 RepID=A0A4D6NF77_VIGUN|nr:hypothetical protein DEO72_LG10g2401 [Vigna unguiculata]QCE11169.1 hypothetical protein DEO72_LG10g2402 [Vigna unguiculata]
MSASSKIVWRSTQVTRHKRLPDRLGGDMCCQAPSAYDATLSTSIALLDSPYREAQHTSILYWFCSHRLEVRHHHEALHQ